MCLAQALVASDLLQESVADTQTHSALQDLIPKTNELDSRCAIFGMCSTALQHAQKVSGTDLAQKLLF